jgi:hypothetical protein
MTSDASNTAEGADKPESETANAHAIKIWPTEVLAKHLVSTDSDIRLSALAMAMQPAAPINECVAELVHASALAEAELQRDAASTALQLSAAAMGALDPKRLLPMVLDRLAQLVDRKHPDSVRLFAAHSLFRLGQLPLSAAAGVAELLLSETPHVRKVALLALSPFARQCAAAITTTVASLPADKWSAEALAALAKSAGDDATGKRAVEAFVIRHVAGQAIVPTGIAAYVALAQLNPGGQGLNSLIRIVSEGTDSTHVLAALAAIGQLGETAKAATRAIADRLVTTVDPALEEALCRAFVQVRGEAQHVPLPCVLKRIADAPDRAVAAHCMLLGMHPKAFTNAVVVLQQRFVSAGDALKAILAQTYKLLTGTELTDVAAPPALNRS